MVLKSEKQCSGSEGDNANEREGGSETMRGRISQITTPGITSIHYSTLSNSS